MTGKEVWVQWELEVLSNFQMRVLPSLIFILDLRRLALVVLRSWEPMCQPQEHVELVFSPPCILLAIILDLANAHLELGRKLGRCVRLSVDREGWFSVLVPWHYSAVMARQFFESD